MAIRKKGLKADLNVGAIFLKDTHFRYGFNAPSGRKETYFEEIDDKVDDVIVIGKKQKCKTLIILGDVFDIKQPSLWSSKAVRKTHKVLARLKSWYDNIYTIAGNHDLIGSARSNKKDSMYSYFVEAGLLNDIHGKYINLSDNVYLTGLDFNSDIKALKRELKRVSAEAKKLKMRNPKAKVICVFHEHLIAPEERDKVWGDSFNYRYAVANYKYIDVFCAGHYHKGYATQIYRGKIFINPFNFSRLARSHYTLDGSHIPTAVYLNIKTFKYKDIPIKHLPFNDSINIEEMLQEVRETLDISNFIDNLEDINTDSEVSIDNVSDEVKEKISYYLDIANNK